MDEIKRQRLEAAGWRVGTAEDFLGLSPAEAKLVELKLAHKETPLATTVETRNLSQRADTSVSLRRRLVKQRADTSVSRRRRLLNPKGVEFLHRLTVDNLS